MQGLEKHSPRAFKYGKNKKAAGVRVRHPPVESERGDKARKWQMAAFSRRHRLQILPSPTLLLVAALALACLPLSTQQVSSPYSSHLRSLCPVPGIRCFRRCREAVSTGLEAGARPQVLPLTRAWSSILWHPRL
jgi:hypothetical protein